MAKGVDGTFLHYGIRQEDLAIIESIATKYELDFEWVKEYILEEFHNKRVNAEELSDRTIEDVIKQAIKQIN